MKRISAFVEGKDLIHAIIETPQGSRNKYSYDPVSGLFKFDKVMPLGMAFPYDFGFIPGTKGGDDDPLDVVVITDAPMFQGSLVECRVLGALLCDQKEGDGERERNDRVVAVPTASIAWEGLKSLDDLGEKVVKELKDFFATYRGREGAEYRTLKVLSASSAVQLIRRSQT